MLKMGDERINVSRRTILSRVNAAPQLAGGLRSRRC